MCQQTLVAVQAAETVLEKKNKFDSAIKQGVSELQGLISAQLEAERTFRRLESAQAIGEASAGLAAAKKSAADAKSALESASLRLNGFRAALGELGSLLVESYDAIAAALPAHNASVIAAFEAECQAALTTWNLVLGRRHAIEGVLKQSLDGVLVEPMPAAVTISPDVSRPSETLDALESSIKVIANMKKISERQLKPGTYYDPRKIYKLVSDRWATRGVPKGSLVCDASFEPGRLSQIIELGDARPTLDRDQISGVVLAAKKSKEIEDSRAAKELADSERNLRSGPNESSSRRRDLEAAYNYQPPLEDLAKRAADAAAGIAASAEERDRQKIIDESVRLAADRDAARAAKSAEQNKLRQGPSAGPKLEWPEALS